MLSLYISQHYYSINDHQYGDEYDLWSEQFLLEEVADVMRIDLVLVESVYSLESSKGLVFRMLSHSVSLLLDNGLVL